MASTCVPALFMSADGRFHEGGGHLQGELTLLSVHSRCCCCTLENGPFGGEQCHVEESVSPLGCSSYWCSSRRNHFPVALLLLTVMVMTTIVSVVGNRRTIGRQARQNTTAPPPLQQHQESRSECVADVTNSETVVRRKLRKRRRKECAQCDWARRCTTKKDEITRQRWKATEE